MKNIGEKVYIAIILVIILTSIIIVKPLDDLDEIWNYNFAKNITDGNMPYKDFNMITTPLLPNICAIFLAILGNELIVMRILAIILCTAILLLTNKILENLSINKQIGYIFLIFMVYIFKDYFRIDYNFFVLLNVLAIIYIETKTILKDEEHKMIYVSKIDILLGILAGICISTKQTTGIFVSIALIGYPILKVNSIKELKIFLKKMLYRIIGIVIPLAILAIYFTVNGLWYYFIDYCILGIKTFSNVIPYTNLVKNGNILIKTLSILVPVFLIGLFILIIVKRKEKNTEYKNLTILFALSVASMVVAFPISDNIHFLVGALPSLISMMYIISIIIKKIKYKRLKKFIGEYLKAFNFLISVFIVVISIIPIYQYIKVKDNYKELKHFLYIPSSKEQSDKIIQMGNYIQEQEQNVYILDAVAELYTTPIDKYTKNYDMFLKGNLGKDGEDGIIENFKNEGKSIFLIKNEKYGRNWQNPEKVRSYIINNMDKIGEILYFDIYQNNLEGE